MDMNRRQLLQTAATGLGTVVLGSLASSYAKAAETLASERTILRLTIREAEAEMVDLTRAYVWVFDDGTPRLPGPVITCTEGDRLDIAVTNELPGQHGFEVPGVVSSGLIGQGQTRLLKFLAPPAGTYIYLDPFNAPLNRVMGLHGVLVSLPRVGNTPYSYPTPSVQQLFDDLGTHEVFPGHPWQREATKIWVFTQVDPDLNQAVRDGAITTGDDYLAAFQPRYFTINGRSGYFSAHEATDTHLHSTVGHPHLIRNVNVGLWGHSPHVHANHCYRLAIDGAVQDNVVLLDTWTVRPMQRVDMLFPFVQPPDIPPQTWQKVIDGVQEEPFPMDYPMHCHQEVSNTAAGGNYPQGNVTHIVIAGPVDQRAAPGNPPAGYPPQPNFDLHMMPEE